MQQDQEITRSPTVELRVGYPIGCTLCGLPDPDAIPDEDSVPRKSLHQLLVTPSRHNFPGQHDLVICDVCADTLGLDL